MVKASPTVPTDLSPLQRSQMHGPIKPTKMAPGRPRVGPQQLLEAPSSAGFHGALGSPREGPAPLAVHGLNVGFGGQPVLQNVSLDLPAGSLVALVGPNGGGKSTFLRACLGLLTGDVGARVDPNAVHFFGEPLGRVRGRVAYMPQRERVDWSFPATVRDVVTMGLYGQLGWLRRIRRHQRAAVMASLERVGMAEFADRQIGALSGGQQKRVFLARTLVQGADLFLMDEPFAGVDAVSETIITRELAGLRDAGSTVLVVHHDLLAVRRSFDACVLLNRRVCGMGPVGDALCQESLAAAYGGVVPLSLLEFAAAPRRPEA